MKMPNPLNKPIETNETVEWMSLDDCVSQDSDSVLYVRVNGDDAFGLSQGDVAVVDRSIKTKAGGIILTEAGGRFTFRQSLPPKPTLYLVGKEKPKADKYEIIGTVTHVLKTLS